MNTPENTTATSGDQGRATQVKELKFKARTLFETFAEPVTSTAYKCLPCFNIGIKRIRRLGRAGDYANYASHFKVCKGLEGVDWQSQVKNKNKFKVQDKQRDLEDNEVDVPSIFLKLLICDKVPFTAASSPAMQEIIRGAYLCGQQGLEFEPPSASSLKRWLRNLYLNTCAIIKKELKGKRFVIILDGWTRGENHYIVWIAKTASGQFFLGFRPVPNATKSSGMEQYRALKELLAEFDLDERQVLAVVGDHADENRILAANIGSGGRPFIGCLAHRLNLATKKCNKVLLSDSIVEKVKELMRWGRRTQNWAKLRSAILQLNPELKNAKGYKCVLENQTRWNSRKDMLARHLKLVPAFDKLDQEDLILDGNKKPLEVLTKKEIKKVKEAVEFLDKFITFYFKAIQTKDLSFIKGSTMISQMLEEIESNLRVGTANTLQEKALDALRYYLDPGKCTTTSNTFLRRIQPTVEQVIVKISANRSMTEQERLIATKYFRNDTLHIGSESNASINRRVSSRVNEILAKAETSVANQTKKSDFLELNWVPCTSVEAERSFSSAKYFLQDHRLSLASDTSEMLMTLHGNLSLWETRMKELTMSAKDRRLASIVERREDVEDDLIESDASIGGSSSAWTSPETVDNDSEQGSDIDEILVPSTSSLPSLQDNSSDETASIVDYTRSFQSFGHSGTPSNAGPNKKSTENAPKSSGAKSNLKKPKTRSQETDTPQLGIRRSKRQRDKSTIKAIKLTRTKKKK